MNNIPSFSDIINFVYEFAEDMAFGYLDDPTIAFDQNNSFEIAVKSENNNKIIDAPFNIEWYPKESAIQTNISKSPEIEIMLETLPRGFLYSKNPTLDIFTGNYSITLLNHTNHAACFDKFGRLFLDGFFALTEYQNSHMILYSFKDYPNCIFMEKKYSTDNKKTYKHLIQLRKEEEGFIIETNFAEDHYLYNNKLNITGKINLYSQEICNNIKEQKQKVFTLLFLTKNTNDLYFSKNSVPKDIICYIHSVYNNILKLEFHDLERKDADTAT